MYISSCDPYSSHSLIRWEKLYFQGVDMDPMALNGGISAIAAIGRTITKAWARLDTETKIKISFVSVDEN